ncbi:ATP-dependent DNA ligase [Sandaracinus amylolyticus]|uniref:DNA ligase (ATP) n=1 Tax=Sandaracinus amylolyticus TaxID=927083 RepID=A0A0F6VYZ0_9BACT|nr:ATP-dependent DNA ligase [Sandaracinus amylolyticus]AKF03198.1 ATP-dependent DNA ligase [Sandaracinus amylolyticus]
MLAPPIAPMLAELARELPRGDFLYEPKWDGFRCIAFVERDGRVDLRSRHGKPFARYFPELVRALAAIGERCVIDGEIVIAREGGFDFAALMLRTHPASTRVARLATETPATFVAFDLLAVGDETWTERPFVERRARLESLLARVPREGEGRVELTPATDDVAVASAWLEGAQRGIDGVVAKPRTLRYAPGKRAMIKVKPEHTADCVLAGMRVHQPTEKEPRPAVASLLLGLWDGDVLRHVGVCSTFTAARRRALVEELRADVVALEGHPWEHGFGLEPSPMGRLPGAAGRWAPGEMALDWLPLRPERVVEVAYDHLDATRFRHPARFVRWRVDREARSCTFEQLPR